MKKWPKYYYIIMAVILMLFSFGGAFLNNLLSGEPAEDQYSTYGSGEEYAYPEEEQYGGQYPGEEGSGGESGGGSDTSVSDPVVAYVMAGTLSDYPNVTISDAVSGYLSEVSWNHYQDSGGQSVVEAKGFVGSDHNEALAIHFTYDESGNISLEWVGSDYSDEITTTQLETYKSEIFGSGSSLDGATT